MFAMDVWYAAGDWRLGAGGEELSDEDERFCLLLQREKSISTDLITVSVNILRAT